MTKQTTRRPAVPSAGPCPCGLEVLYAECCGRFHSGRAEPATAEQLMRSRYSAFVVRDAGYLLRTWSSAERPGNLPFDGRLRWTGLEILARTGGSAFHTEGTVEFRARFVRAGEPGEQHENSRFIRESGRWVYQRPLDDPGLRRG